ncbi:hypothetical protein HNQ71_005246 [Mesorhizobium sangaii]|uniref:Uncharacterized protein n=1 Tax=Mesorhizobium sangaii TaxID=505389 RepID=A0A841PB76_9HYPH|nr:hypothetical protein [Mesorhizobium sangaii]
MTSQPRASGTIALPAAISHRKKGSEVTSAATDRASIRLCQRITGFSRSPTE